MFHRSPKKTFKCKRIQTEGVSRASKLVSTVGLSMPEMSNAQPETAGQKKCIRPPRGKKKKPAEEKQIPSSMVLSREALAELSQKAISRTSGALTVSADTLREIMEKCKTASQLLGSQTPVASKKKAKPHPKLPKSKADKQSKKKSKSLAAHHSGGSPLASMSTAAQSTASGDQASKYPEVALLLGQSPTNSPSCLSRARDGLHTSLAASGQTDLGHSNPNSMQWQTIYPQHAQHSQSQPSYENSGMGFHWDGSLS